MDHLTTEARNPASTHLDELTPLELVHLMNAEDARVIPAVASQAEAIARAIELIAERLRAGGRLLYAGAGTSGRLGVLDATECPPTFNSPLGQVVGVIAGGPAALTQAVEGAEDHPEYGERDVQAVQLSAGDVLVGIATSGRTPYVLGALAYARRQGAVTIGLACNADSELAALVDIALLPVVGPEVLSGSTRLKAGTATKLVLNMLTTGSMVRLGKTYGNLMVDLRATNSKLRARSNRIVRLLTGISTEEAEALLQQCGGELKTALVVRQAQLSVEQARAQLQAAGGQVRQTLERARPAEAVVRTPSSARPLYLGIDGGGSHTVALLATADPADTSDRGASWSLLGRGEAGSSNLQAVGIARALQGLDEAVDRAFAAAGLARIPVTAACLGLAGADRRADQEILEDWVRRRNVCHQVVVTSDVALLLAAGTPQGWGLALVAGTGSIAYGRTPEGHTARAGGWGYLLGDEGSAYALVLAALRAVACAADGRGPPTLMTDGFLRKLGLSQPQQLIPTLYRGGWDRASLAALAPIVFAAADAADPSALALIEQGARELAAMTAAVARQLGLEAKAVPLALAGGVLLANPVYRQRVLRTLQAEGWQLAPVELVQEPARGAVQLAVGGHKQ